MKYEIKSVKFEGAVGLRGLICALCLVLCAFRAGAVQVVAAVNGNPITDADITDRTKIMPPSLGNREAAKNAIIDDYLRLEYAKQFKIDPSDKEVASKLSDHKGNPQAKLAAKAAIAWQMAIMRTIVPQVAVSDSDIKQEMDDLERERGLPFEMKLLRLTGVPQDSYAKLTRPKNCAAASGMARDLGGEPLEFSALEYELAPEIREVLIGLENLRWSPLKNKMTFLICEKKKTKEWGKLDEVVKQNALYKRALFQADQLLKQLRRKAVIS